MLYYYMYINNFIMSNCFFLVLTACQLYFITNWGFFSVCFFNGMPADL